MTNKNPAAVSLGRLGGKATSPAKSAAVAANDAAGGRPAKNGIYRAYDTTTEWMAQPRATVVAAQADADRHNQGCANQGGYGSAIVVRRDEGRCQTMAGEPVWPQHGRSCGAVRWPNGEVSGMTSRAGADALAQPVPDPVPDGLVRSLIEGAELTQGEAARAIHVGPDRLRRWLMGRDCASWRETPWASAELLRRMIAANEIGQKSFD